MFMHYSSWQVVLICRLPLVQFSEMLSSNYTGRSNLAFFDNLLPDNNVIGTRGSAMTGTGGLARGRRHARARQMRAQAMNTMPQVAAKPSASHRKIFIGEVALEQAANGR
jgi:hypothetical protein